MVSVTMERALQFLRNHKDVALATSEDNIPKLRIFQVMKQEGNVLYFATSEQKAVWRELRKNPNVELIAYEGNISVRCSGMVNFNVEDDTKRWIYEHNAVLQRLYSNYDQMVYFCLPIAEMDYYDLQPTPPEFLHFDLMAGEVSHGLANSTDMIDGFTKTNKQLARE
jgi:uncharacterized pyridoxamine 5'-phosphate oxidase family protein